MRFGVEPSALVADIRECERVCAEEEPDQALEFVEYVHPVSDAGTKDELDTELERLLAGSPDAAGHLIPVVPTSVLEHFGQAHSFTIRIGGARPPAVPILDLADFLRRTRPQRDGERVTVLRGGHVNLNADDQGDEILARARADKWLEASVSLGSRRFFLMDGDWFATVAALPRGRTLPADFKPGKVVYAILLENGRQLTPDTLFPFSQATLAHPRHLRHRRRGRGHPGRMTTQASRPAGLGH